MKEFVCMRQTSPAPTALPSHVQEQAHGKASLGPILCWAVVFADIGSSIYYVPGILYASVGALAGFFVLLTMGAFVLLTLKYAEVSQRFPEGGGVVSVAAQAINSWAGALGGMLILVSYFLTAAISCLSAIQYFGVVVPAVLPFVLWITIGVLILLGILNWIGINESAKVSMIGALVAFGSDLAILWTVFMHLSPGEVWSLFVAVFSRQTLTPTSILVGFAGAFLAFSGLESISQLSPVMKTPRKKVIGTALFLVVLTIGATSPLLTLLATVLQTEEATDPVLSTQLISLLGGHWGSLFLQTEVAISASLILVFASNTAIIGAYHVFMALSRMDFFPSFILKRNRFRNTPHWSIALATSVPIAILLLVKGEINQLGDLYAFGLLGAFTLTCLGLDVIRTRERVAIRHNHSSSPTYEDMSIRLVHPAYDAASVSNTASLNGQKASAISISGIRGHLIAFQHLLLGLWRRLDFWLGLLTTALVAMAWGISLVSRPQAALFGGTVALCGMAVASINYMNRGRPPVAVAQIGRRQRDAVLVMLSPNDPQISDVIQAAISETHGKPLVFLYLGEHRREHIPRPLEIVDPYLDDQEARSAFAQAEKLARAARIPRRFIYRQWENTEPALVWSTLKPSDMIVSSYLAEQLPDINPDRIRYQLTPTGKVAHLLKRW
jgi:amino acid transporter